VTGDKLDALRSELIAIENLLEQARRRIEETADFVREFANTKERSAWTCSIADPLGSSVATASTPALAEARARERFEDDFGRQPLQSAGIIVTEAEAG
jgi:hypothetical protein